MAAAKVGSPPRRVLFVEVDSGGFESFRYVAVDLLGWNAEVFRVNAGDALSVLEASAAVGFGHHLIVLDDRLLGHDRLEFLKELRTLDLPQVPVVFLSQVRTDAATRREADKYNAVECFYDAASFDDFVVAVGQLHWAVAR
jgi:CheY-like chemotaxis protein